MRIKGSNQYQSKWGLSHKTMASVWAVAFFTTVGIQFVQHDITSPCPTDGCKVNVVYAKETKTELQEITDYIVYKFQPHGREVAVKALACFISESGLRSDAYGWNEWNKTADVGVSQINDVHKMTVEERKDWKKNIDKAEQIYVSRGNNFSAWYGKGCK